MKIGKRNRAVGVLLIAIAVYVGIIAAMLIYSMMFGRRMSQWRTRNAMEGIAYNVENILYVMNQYSGTFLSAFGDVEMDGDGFSRLVLTDEELWLLQDQDNGRLLHEFVQSSSLIRGAFFCFEAGVYGKDAYQPYCHRDDEQVYEMEDLYPFMESDLFATVKEKKHNWWHASRKKTAFGEQVLGCCTPIYQNDTSHFIGAFVMDYSLDSLGGYLQWARPFPSSEIYVMNSLGYIIGTTDSVYLGKTLAEVEDWRSDKFGTAMTSFPTLPWQMAMTTPREDVAAYLVDFIMKNLFLAFIGLLLLSLCIYYAIRSSRLQAVEQERMHYELQTVATIQRSLLPPSLPQLKELGIEALLQPAKEVAGDLYEVKQEGDYVYFMIGDVSGKGFQASLFMSMVSGMFRMRVREMLRPAEMVNLINKAFSERNPEMLFCTIVVGRLDVVNGELLLCNAGHNLPILDGKLVELPAGIAVGVDEDYRYKEERIWLQAGDRLYCYTDGVTEAENKAHALFGEARLLALCEQGASLGAIRESVEMFANGYAQSDDITMVELTYNKLIVRKIADIELLHEYMLGEENKMAELAVEEAMVNPLMHGKASYVSVLVQGAGVYKIEDDGVAFDPTQVKVESSPTQEGGQGINLIRQICKQMCYERRGERNILTLEI